METREDECCVATESSYYRARFTEDSSPLGRMVAVNDRDPQVDQESQPNKHIAEDGFLKTLGIDPKKWTVGDRRIALMGIGIGLTIVIISVCGYVFDLPWTGLAKRTFWDWLSLLIVPIVLALGGYLFNRSESRRTKEDAEQQRQADRHIADQRTQDAALQAYLDHIGGLLLEKDKPLRQSKEGDEVRTLARARTLTVLRRLDGERKARVLQFLYESGLIDKNRVVVDLVGADLSDAILSKTNLSGTDLREANLSGANLTGAQGVTNEQLEYQVSHFVGFGLQPPAPMLAGAYMPDGQAYED
jgi:Pentapeptide repeats (8 copies)